MKKILVFLIFLIFSIIIINFQVISVKIDTKNKPLIFDEYDMVIITKLEYLEIIQPLINHKNSIGILTYAYSTDQMYNEFEGRDNPEKIKYFIKNAIETYNISYVLLIGDHLDIPSRYTHVFFDEPFDYPTPDEWIFTSDFYYSDIYNNEGSFSNWDTNDNNVFAEYHWNGNTDNIDLNPDVYVGRLACINQLQVETCVNKIINYETQKSWSKDWFTNLVLISGDGIPFDSESIDESEYLQEIIIDIMDGFIPNRVWASNGGLNDAYNINDAINNGAGFVFFNGHGNHDLWATYLHNTNIMVPPGAYRTYHINELNNNYKLPIVKNRKCP